MIQAERNRLTVDWRGRRRGWWHPEAKRMRGEGASLTAIARYFGVSVPAVRVAVIDEVREAARARSRAHNAARKAVRS